MTTVRVGLCLDHEAPAGAAARKRLAGSDFLVFPEMVDSGYAALRRGAMPHRAGDALLQAFAGYYRSIAPYCVAGSVDVRIPPPPTSNTSLVYHHGRLIFRYDKVHLFRFGGDHRYFRPGKRIGTFTARIPAGRVRCGVVICYDIRFPELVRAMAARGLDILFVPARWPAVRDEAWQTLLKARAMENQIFVVGCNTPGSEGGPSYVFDPTGTMVFTNRTSPRALVHAVTLDLGRIAEAQKLHKNLDEAVVLRSSRIPRRVTARRRPS